MLHYEKRMRLRFFRKKKGQIAAQKLRAARLLILEAWYPQ